MLSQETVKKLLDAALSGGFQAVQQAVTDLIAEGWLVRCSTPLVLTPCFLEFRESGHRPHRVIAEGWLVRCALTFLSTHLAMRTVIQSLAARLHA